MYEYEVEYFFTQHFKILYWTFGLNMFQLLLGQKNNNKKITV